MKKMARSLVAMAVIGAVTGHANAFGTYTQATWDAFVADVNAGTAITFGTPSDAFYGYYYVTGVLGSCTNSNGSTSCTRVGVFKPTQLSTASQSAIQSFISETNSFLSAGQACQNATVGGQGKSYLIVDSSLPTPACLNEVESIKNRIFPQAGASATPTTPTQIATTVTEVAAKVSSQAQRATSIQQATIISTMLSSISNRNIGGGPRRMAIGGERGMAAGNEKPALNAWVNASDSTVNQTSIFSGGVQNYIGGIDYAFNDATVVGVSVGQDTAKLDLFGTKLKSKGTTVAPYISYQFNEVYSVDAALGYSTGDSTYSVGTTGKQDIRRNFSALNANGNWWFADWQVAGKLGYVESEEKLSNFVDGTGAAIAGSTNRIRQLRVGAQVSYWADGVMPYFGVTHVRDLNDPTFGGAASNVGKEAYNVAVGVNFLQGKALTGSVAYTSERGRSNSKNDVLMASLSYRF